MALSAVRDAREALPPGARLMVPVMAAVGGAGRSVVCGLLAAGLAGRGVDTGVLDTVVRLASPWPRWTVRSGGLEAVPGDRPASRAMIRSAASRVAGSDGAGWDVLTDHQAWSFPPLPLPDAPEAWHQLAAAGGWQAAVVDTGHPVAHDIVTARCAGRLGLTARWFQLPYSVPVIAVLATGPGGEAAQTALLAAEAEGLPLRRVVLAVVSATSERAPASLRAAVTMVSGRVGAVVEVPADAEIRARGLQAPARLGCRTLRSAAELAGAVLGLAHHTWGDPLPAATPPTSF